MGKTGVRFIMHFSSVHKECFFFGIKPAKDVLSLLQEGRFQAEPLPSHYRAAELVSVHLPATGLVIVGAELRKNKAWL